MTRPESFPYLRVPAEPILYLLEPKLLKRVGDGEYVDADGNRYGPPLDDLDKHNAAVLANESLPTGSLPGTQEP